MWAKWRYALINTMSYDTWITLAQDRVALTKGRWELIFGAYKDANLTSPEITAEDSELYQDLDGSQETHTRTPSLTTTTSGTDTHKDLAGSQEIQTRTPNITTTSNGSSSGTDTHEDLPQTASASASSYLTSRDGKSSTESRTDKQTGTETLKTEHAINQQDTSSGTTIQTGTETQKDVFGRSHKTTRTHSEIGMTTAEALDKLKDDIKNPFELYAESWSPLFAAIMACPCRGE